MKAAALLLIALFVFAASEEANETAQECEENEIWTNCSSCEPTCWERVKACPKMCYPAKCQCITNYFRDPTGRCVTSDRCPIEDPPKTEVEPQAQQP
ncbi:hypothetical protein QR680_006231 [Steinernema hermaphroditum]|uniref:TIL domain-containing protein n=1 Tax=Steinernema hermaphroditum TaxID=289476 RepID=A0AA39HUV6_9BILA|nr:hypothetical protein QR680_006231 [Steinernema hermaphroditum]